MVNKRRMRHRAHRTNGHSPGTIGNIQLDGKRILNWRLNQGISQKVAAQQIGIATMTYRRCETGVVINLLNASKVSRCLKIPLEQLKAG